MIRTKVMTVAAILIVASAAGAVGAAAGDDGRPPSTAAAASSEPVGRTHPGALSMQRYVPITPCRIVDTRVAGGKLAAGSTRSFAKVGSAAQGGAVCPVPTTASALEMSVTAVSAEGAGYLRLYPGASEPQATFMNYSAALNVANAGAVTVGPASFTAKAYARATHLVIDVFGYYVDGMWAQVSGAGLLESQSDMVASASRVALGDYQVIFRRDVEGCAATASVGQHDSATHANGIASVSELAGNPNGVRITTKDFAGVSVDRPFQVMVDC